MLNSFCRRSSRKCIGRDVAPRSARVGDLRLRPHHLARAPRPTSHELPDGLPLRLVARGAHDEAMMGRPRTNGPGRCLHGYHPVLDTKTELCVRMRALNFGMSTLSGSVKFGADAAAEVAGAIQQGARRALTRMALNAAPEVPVPQKNLGRTGSILPSSSQTRERGSAAPHHQFG